MRMLAMIAVGVAFTARRLVAERFGWPQSHANAAGSALPPLLYDGSFAPN
jgi:hypothetical protein